METILELKGVSIIQSGRILVPEISLKLRKGEHLAITGGAGTGKTSLALALLNKIHHKGQVLFDDSIQSIAWVEQQHHFRNLSNLTGFYYQQRFNSFDAEDAVTVEEYLGGNLNYITNLIERLELGTLLDKPLIQLSNGENKKVQLLLALSDNPDVILLDQPFIGLDSASRLFMHSLIDELAQSGKTIILITQPTEIPKCITQVLTMLAGKPPILQSAAEFDKRPPNDEVRMDSEFSVDKIQLLTSAAKVNVSAPVILMNDVSVRYGDRQILSHINWRVETGERWLLSGPNGAGKSTLLSLITADNPQAYANNIELFGRKRGSGETIWDIKSQLGYLSPEMHLYFESSWSGFESVASGLFDTIGLFRQLNESQIQLVNQWMDLTGISSLKQKMLHQLSLGEQRMILLTRALVKDAPLLILDEPCQGLDEEAEKKMIRLIDQICTLGNKTLIYVTHYANSRPVSITKMLKLDKGGVEYIRNI